MKIFLSVGIVKKLYKIVGTQMFPWFLLSEIKTTWWPISIVLHMSDACWVVMAVHPSIFSGNDLISVLFKLKWYLCHFSYYLNYNEFKLIKFVMKQYGYHYIVSQVWHYNDIIVVLYVKKRHLCHFSNDFN